MGLHHGQANFVTYGKPSLFLDFANKKSLVDRISGNNLITFERASTGTYMGPDGLIKYAAADEARFDHNPTTGESLGLLIEESRTNLIAYSENFNVSFWNKLYGTTIVLNDTISPDGSQTATRVYQSGTTDDGYLVRYAGGGLSVTTGQTYTLSFYTKKVESGGLDRVNLAFDVSGQGSYPIGGDAWFNFSDPNSFLSNTGAFYEELPNGWYRIGLTGTATLDGTIEYGFRIDRSNSVGVYVWGIQLELGSFATSYIPTSGSQFTRQPDNASITGTNFTNFYNQNEGTFFANFRTELNITNNIWSVNNYPTSTFGTVLNYFRLLTLDNTIHTQYNVAGTNLYPTFPLSSNNYQKTVQSYDINSSPIISSVNGTLGTGPGNIYGTSPNFTQLEFGKNSDNRNIIGQYTISQLTYYPTRLTNTQLQNLTR